MNAAVPGSSGRDAPWLRPFDVVIAASAAAVATLLLSAVALIVWPGGLALLAPLACPSGFPDPFVMEHVYRVPGEVRKSWSLVCMSAHGALHRPDMTVPQLLVGGAAWLACTAVALGVAMRMRRGRHVVG